MPGEPKIDKNEQRKRLQELNRQYTECISREFLPEFLAGKNVQVENFCVDIRSSLQELDRKVYPNDRFWAECISHLLIFNYTQNITEETDTTIETN